MPRKPISFETASRATPESLASASVDPLDLALSAFEHKLLSPACTLGLNNTVGINNVRLSESLSDLDTKSSIITSGTLTVDEFQRSQQLDSKIQLLRESMGEKLSPQYLEKQGVLCKKVGSDFTAVSRKISIQLLALPRDCRPQVSNGHDRRVEDEVFDSKSQTKNNAILQGLLHLRD